MLLNFKRKKDSPMKTTLSKCLSPQSSVTFDYFFLREALEIGSASDFVGKSLFSETKIK